MRPDFPEHAVGRLLREAGMSADFTWDRISGGANNRVFRIRSGRESVLLKVYFRHPDDPRDRLGAEYAFCKFAWENGLHWTPQPLAADFDERLGLYEFIEGRGLTSGSVNREQVAQALEFYVQLNLHRASDSARDLPVGSEACFSMRAHLACVERRLERLLDMQVLTDLDRELALFVRTDLSPAWERVRAFVGRGVEEMGLSLDEEVAKEDRRISPSDFGFHNALLQGDCRLRFIDFEYAGWDDPAKTISDFFCQPAVPVPVEYRDDFSRRVLADLSAPDLHYRRTKILRPVYVLKWCTILLNDFLPAGDERRRFSAAGEDPSQRKTAQLQKARQALNIEELTP
ncbi:MAG: aminoglycoside phosphotransferase family protein [Desulfomonile tiedjei]|nr:aminoglycoside phosphotransferase family protein [Desulfomonile tiedjei]